MDDAGPKPHDDAQPKAAPIAAARYSLAVESSLPDDLPVSDAEIDAILRLLGDDLAAILR